MAAQIDKEKINSENVSQNVNITRRLHQIGENIFDLLFYILQGNMNNASDTQKNRTTKMVKLLNREIRPVRAGSTWNELLQ